MSDEINVISASGTVGIQPTDEIILPIPAIPNTEGKIFLLFEWEDYSGGGGLNDLKWSGSLESCISRRSLSNAEIAVQTRGQPILVLRWLQNAWMDNGYRVIGWTPVVRP